MREFKASTKQGQNIISRASYHEGYFLKDVYGSVSQSKTNAWVLCHHEFCNSPTSEDFHICSHNTFQFSVAWNDIKDGERILRVETANNSFLVWLER